MSLLRFLGLGREPHIEWLIEACGAEAREVVDNRLLQHRPRHRRWEGRVDGVPATFYTSVPGRSGGTSIYLGKAGPQFVDGVNEYRAVLYRRPEAPPMSIEDPRWLRVVAESGRTEDLASAIPEEAFELGVRVGAFALELDCPLDPRPIFPILPALRPLLDAMSGAVDAVLLYPAGVSLALRVDRCTPETIAADLRRACRILERISSIASG